MIKNLDTKIAVTYGEKKFSYAVLRKTVADWAMNLNIKVGDHVVIFAENSPEWIFAFYSVWQKGGIAVPVDNLATVDETAYILNDCEPKVIFTSKARKETIERAMQLAGIKVEVLLLDDFNCVISADEDFELMHPDPENTALIIYTSGTTGNPKGVMLTYTNLLTNITAVSYHIPIYKPESTIMMLLPVHHVLPLVGSIIIPLYIGATIAISPSMQSADLMKTLNDNAVSIIIGVPRLYAALRKGIMDKIRQSMIARLLFAIARSVNSQKFSRKVFKTVHNKLGGSIKSLVSGGAALDKEIASDFKILGFEVLEGYGMTEAAPMISFTRPGRVKIGSPGEVMSETKVVIRDGEITASGPNIMKGYYNKPEETAEILKDGWLYTGDLGYVDEQGFLFITGRKKEIIILSNGKKVNPVELEEKLVLSKYIKECGVFHHDDQLQVIVVPEYALLSKDADKSIEEFIKWEVIEPFNKTVSAYKKIMGIHVTDEELPRTKLGKLQRYKLPSLAVLADLNETVSDEVPNTPEFRMIAEFLEKEKSKHVLPGHHVEMDLGMDSLDMVNFQAWLMQTFGVDMEPSEMTSYSNIAKLSEHIAQKKTRIEEGRLDWTDIIKEKVNLKIPANWITGRWMVYASKVFFFLYFRIKAKGTSNIPEAPVIFVPNHQSYFDGLFIASFLRRRQLKNTYFYAKEKHFRQAWLKYLANRNNIIVVDINNDLKESIQRMAEVLRQKRNLIIFPEGTRSKNGDLGDFKKTFAILSRELNIPIVPVTIKGAYEALPSGSKFPIPWKRISVEFMQPVYPGTHSYDSLTDHVRSKIEGNIQTVLSHKS